MHRRILAHVRGNVVAYLALFLALTGVAYAAPKFIQVGDQAGGDLTGTYPNPEIKANAVGSAEVANNSLTGEDVNESSLEGLGAVLAGRINGLSTGAAFEFGAPSGTTVAAASGAAVDQLSPNLPLVARDLSVNLTQAPGIGGGRGIFLIVNGANALTCTVPQNETTCNSGAASAAVPAGSTLSVMVLTPPGGTAAAADARFAFRLTP